MPRLKQRGGMTPILVWMTDALLDRLTKEASLRGVPRTTLITLILAKQVRLAPPEEEGSTQA